MSDFLSRLAGRALGQAPGVVPLVAPCFAPEKDGAPPEHFPEAKDVSFAAGQVESVVAEEQAVMAPGPERMARIRQREMHTQKDNPAATVERGAEQAENSAARLRRAELAAAPAQTHREVTRPVDAVKGSPPASGAAAQNETGGRNVRPEEGEVASLHEEETRATGFRSASEVLRPTVLRPLVGPADAAPKEPEQRVGRESRQEIAPAVVERAVPPVEREPAESEAAPTIRVTIGRIEVRAVPPPLPPARKPSPRAPKLSLEEYLHRVRDE